MAKKKEEEEEEEEKEKEKEKKGSIHYWIHMSSNISNTVKKRNGETGGRRRAMDRLRARRRRERARVALGREGLRGVVEAFFRAEVCGL